MPGLENQRRRQGDGVAGHADQQIALVKTIGEDLVAARPGLLLARRQVDSRDQTEIAHVDHLRQIGQIVRRRLPVFAQFTGFVEQTFRRVNIQRRQRRRAGHRMTGISIAMEKLD